MYKLQKIRLLILGLILFITYAAGCGGSKSPDNPINQDPPTQPPTIIEDGEVINTDNVSIDGIVFYFDKQYPTGKFANGDYWVKGPVTIIQITPEFDGQNNGWEVNPIVDGGHGFQAGGWGGGFDPNLVPPIPYTTKDEIESIVKTTPSGQSIPCIKKAVVLTVVNETPPSNGAAVFRPPYVGTDKPYYYVNDLRTDLLPTYAPVDNMTSLEQVEKDFGKLWLEHKKAQMGRSLRPQDNMADYQPGNTPAICNAALRLMMDDSIEAKMPALIKYVQYGIDKIHMLYLGQTWPGGGGHEPGHRLGSAFAAVMLDIQQAKDLLSNATFFDGNNVFVMGKNIENLMLWGDRGSETNYWDYIRTHSGNRSIMDPYGYIDGGFTSDGSYQVITVQSHKGELLATHLMPVLKEAWNMDEWKKVQNYTDRWVHFGQWTLPDPYAPFNSNKVYGVDYGPDPNNPGEAILGDGRFPETHGAQTDKGQYRSKFVASLWDTYRASVPGEDNIRPFAAIISHVNGRTVSGTVTLQASAYGIHGIHEVEFMVNGQSIGIGTQEVIANPTGIDETKKNLPYRLSWDTNVLTNGSYALQVVATDNKGNIYHSSIVNLEVQN